MADETPVHELHDSWCFDCLHLHEERRAGVYTCAAFPYGIPATYIDGMEKHRTPDTDQGNDVVFEPTEDEATE